jgi:hypothetical protein
MSPGVQRYFAMLVAAFLGTRWPCKWASVDSAGRDAISPQRTGESGSNRGTSGEKKCGIPWPLDSGSVF